MKSQITVLCLRTLYLVFKSRAKQRVGWKEAEIKKNGYTTEKNS